MKEETGSSRLLVDALAVVGLDVDGGLTDFNNGFES